jgi:hypothetical protein
MRKHWRIVIRPTNASAIASCSQGGTALVTCRHRRRGGWDNAGNLACQQSIRTFRYGATCLRAVAAAVKSFGQAARLL